MTGVPPRDGDGAKPEYVGIPGETDRDAATAREIEIQAAAMPPGTFKSPDDPNAYAEDHGETPKPKPGTGQNLREVDAGAQMVSDTLRLMQQRDTPAGRTEAGMAELLTSMRRLLEDRKPQPVGAPPDVQSQRIETYHAWAVQAARDIVTNETERDALIATLVTIKNRQLTDVASGRRPHDAKGAVKSRNKRARKLAEGSQFT